LKLKFTSHLTRGGFYFDDICQELVRNIEKLSGGRIEIEAHGAGEVASAGKEFEAVRTGMIDIAMFSPGYEKGIMPTAGLQQGVLGGLRMQNEVDTVFWKAGWAEILRNEVYAPLDVYYLGPSIYSNGCRIVSRNPITSLEDFKNLKVRALGSPYSDLLSKLGSKVVYIPWGEIYTSLAMGTVDAAVYGDFPSTRDLKTHEFAPYHLDPPLTYIGSNAYIVNMDTWNSLPEDLQYVLQAACWQNIRYGGIATMDNLLRAWKEIHAQGAEITRFSSEEDLKAFQMAEMEVLDEIAASDPICAKMAEIYKDVMRTRGYLD